jgi:hypothetical protein
MSGKRMSKYSGANINNEDSAYDRKRRRALANSTYYSKRPRKQLTGDRPDDGGEDADDDQPGPSTDYSNDVGQSLDDMVDIPSDSDIDV